MIILHFQYCLLLCSFISFSESFNVSYSDYANHYNFLFNNYRASSKVPTVRAIIFVETLFDLELTHAQGYVNMFAYSCYYWIDPSLPTWDYNNQFKLKFLTFSRNPNKCPLSFPFIKSSSQKDFVTISYYGVVLTCPHTSRKIVCNYVASSKYPLDIYSCNYPLSIYTDKSWPVECGNYNDIKVKLNTTSNDNCRELNEDFYVHRNSKVGLSSKDWLIKKISISANKRSSYLTILLQRNKGPQYLNDVMLAITLGVLSSSVLLIPFHNNIRIFISVFFMFASNVWLRFGLAEQAFVQYSLNENLIRYYQVVLIVQLITLVISCVNSLIVSKLYSHHQPPLFLLKICAMISVLGRIDPIFKKEIYFVDGIPLHVDVNDDKSDQNSAILSASKVGWKEITLIIDRVLFIIILIIVLITGVVFLN